MSWENWIGRVTFDGGVATGFLVGPNDLLTNAHVVLDDFGNVVNNFQVEFGNGQFANGTFANYYDVADFRDGNGTIAYNNVRFDLALVTLDEPIGYINGHFGLAHGSLWQDPSLNFAGHPGGGVLQNDFMPVFYNNFDFVIEYSSYVAQPGASGSPLWVLDGNDRYVVGVHSTSDGFGNGNAALFSPETFDDIVRWIAENGDGTIDTTPIDTVPDYVEDVVLLYNAALDRDGVIDLPGMNFWIDRVEAGMDVITLAFNLLTSQEFRDTIGEPYNIQDPRYLTNGALVEELYINVLDRLPEPGGYSFWVNHLATDQIERDEFLYAIATSRENVAGSPEINALVQTSPGYWEFDF